MKSERTETNRRVLFALPLVVASMAAQPCAAAQAGAVSESLEGLVLAIDFPAHIDVVSASGAPLTSVAVTAKLTNTTKALKRHAFATCQTANWQVTDAQGAPVESKPRPKICPMRMVPFSLAPGQAIAFKDTVVLDGSKLKDGGHYVLRYSYFGIPAPDTAFTVTRPR
jgi:hypothetical protein